MRQDIHTDPPSESEHLYWFSARVRTHIQLHHSSQDTHTARPLESKTSIQLHHTSQETYTATQPDSFITRVRRLLQLHHVNPDIHTAPSPKLENTYSSTIRVRTHIVSTPVRTLIQFQHPSQYTHTAPLSERKDIPLQHL